MIKITINRAKIANNKHSCSRFCNRSSFNSRQETTVVFRTWGNSNKTKDSSKTNSSIKQHPDRSSKGWTWARCTHQAVKDSNRCKTRVNLNSSFKIKLALVCKTSSLEAFRANKSSISSHRVLKEISCRAKALWTRFSLAKATNSWTHQLASNSTRASLVCKETKAARCFSCKKCSLS